MSIASILHPTPVLSSAFSPPRPRLNPKSPASFLPRRPPLYISPIHHARFHLPSRWQPTRWRSSTNESSPPSASEEEDEGEDEDAEGVAERKGRRSSVSQVALSVLLFGFYVAILYYVTQLSPDQTPYRDMYFLEKLLFLKGDDGFRMNEVLVALWYVMGWWPIMYSMLLLPTGRSSKGSIPVWPFVSLSFVFGAYALVPYFILWKPPPPPVGEEEIGSWPLNFLESKITAGIVSTAGLGLVVYACLADGSVWTEFFQYFRESRLVHVTSIDFMLLIAFSSFWMYNDSTARRFDKGSWFVPLAVIPVVGPALYVLLRPSLSSLPTAMVTNKKD